MTQEQLKAVLNTLSKELWNVESIPNDLLFTMGQRILLSTWKEIEWIEAADYYSCLHVGSKNLMLRETIKQLAGDFNPRKFVRIHRFRYCEYRPCT